MRRRALLARTALLTTAAGLAGCTDAGDGTAAPTESPTASPTPTPSTVETPAGDALAVVDHELTRSNEGSDSELVSVDAVIENERESAVTDVRAVARFFDEAGDVLDRSEAHTSRLAAGGRWEVELVFPGSGDDARAVAEYQLIVERDD